MARKQSEAQGNIEQKRLDSLVRKNRERIEQLIAYEEAGFRKMELMDTFNTNRPIPVFFILNEGTPTYRLGAMVIDLPEFIENTLGPKLQAIAQDKFVISAFRSDTNALVYSTDASTGSTAIWEGDESQKKSFWLLPGHYLSISLTGATIDDLVRERMINESHYSWIVSLYTGVGHLVSLPEHQTRNVSGSGKIRICFERIS